MIITGPHQHLGEPRRSRALISLADLLPTFADWAGARIPTLEEIDGKNFAPYLRAESEAPRSWLYSYLGTGAAIRDAEWVLDAHDPIGGHEGRLYRYQKRYGNVLDSGREAIPEDTTDPDAIAARARFIEILDTAHRFDTDNPHVMQGLQQYSEAAFPHRLNTSSPRRNP